MNDNMWTDLGIVFFLGIIVNLAVLFGVIWGILEFLQWYGVI